MSKTFFIVLIGLLVVSHIANAGIINVQIKGIDDGVKTSKKQDYEEAVLFAKHKALELAGVNIQPLITVQNLNATLDYIESKGMVALSPGHFFLDMGYVADGTYQILMIGQINTVAESIESKEVRYAKGLMDNGEKAMAHKILIDIINSGKSDSAVAEAMYYQVEWKFSSNSKKTLGKMKSRYPNSKYVNRLETLLDVLVPKITGRKSRFIIYDNFVVRDIKTGLEWITSHDRNANWFNSQQWAPILNRYFFDGGGWKVPTTTELKTLYIEGAGTRNMTPLLKTTGWWVWAADEITGYGSGSSWYFNFSDGKAYWYYHNRLTSYNLRAFAVRSRN